MWIMFVYRTMPEKEANVIPTFNQNKYKYKQK
jgi:hypothetical protein